MNYDKDGSPNLTFSLIIQCFQYYCINYDKHILPNLTFPPTLSTFALGICLESACRMQDVYYTGIHGELCNPPTSQHHHGCRRVGSRRNRRSRSHTQLTQKDSTKKSVGRPRSQLMPPNLTDSMGHAQIQKVQILKKTL